MNIEALVPQKSGIQTRETIAGLGCTVNSGRFVVPATHWGSIKTFIITKIDDTFRGSLGKLSIKNTFFL